MAKSLAQRRGFIGQVGVGAAASLAAGLARASGSTANDSIQVGCIGTGGRCRRLMSTLQQIPGVKISAVCDIWDQHLAAGRSLADKQAFVTKEYERLLERKDVDAVLIATPDHWHVPMTIAACQAGKDVYVEKPLTHDPAEGEAVISAVKRSGRIVQVGMQQRSMPHLQKGRELLKSGQLGRIHKVHLTWNRNTPRSRSRSLDIDPATVDWKRFLGNARPQPFDAYRFRHWRWFWDFGGGIFTDLMVHFIDVANWCLELEDPSMAVSIGDHYMAEGIWETPDTVQTLFQYEKKDVQVYFEGTFVNARNAAMMEFMGTNATLYMDRGRYEVHPERKRKIQASEYVLGAGARGADFYNKPDGERLHLENWLDCVRSRLEPNAPVQAGVAAALAAHRANQALRSRQAVHS